MVLNPNYPLKSDGSFKNIDAHALYLEILTWLA